MSDQEQKQASTSISKQPGAENKKASTELSEEELKQVSGGREASAPSVSQITVTKTVDSTLTTKL